MASTRFRMIAVVVFVVALSALEAYQWNGGPKDKAKMRACVGGSVSFPWSIKMGRGETMLGRDWWFKVPDKVKTQIATYEGKHFYATENSRVEFLPNAGLSLRDARLQDSGNYSVQVKLRNKRTLVSVKRTVTLTVSDRPPASKDGALYITLGDVVRDDVTENWSLQLHCGRFVDLGHPPVDVIWKTPSGEVRKSSYQDNGMFVLSVSSPVQGGNYYCRLPLSAPAARCLTATSPLNASAHLYVDDKVAMLLLLDARQREQEQKIADQANLLEHQANLLERQAMQISQQNQTISELTKLSFLMSASNTASCADWLTVDPLSGVHTLWLSGESVGVYCDQTTDNGGWTVFQRRQDASVDFYRNWADYRNGFGDPEGNFWLGLDKLHKLTTSQRFELRVDLQKCDGTKGHATYSGFYVEDISHNFTLRFDKFTGGNAGDSLSYHRGRQFSTKDKDHDTYRKSCAENQHGAWWFGDCRQSHLNGAYNANKHIRVPFIWNAFSNTGINALQFSEMKIRPI